MSIVYVLTTLISEDGDNATMEQIRKKNKWDNKDYVCKGLILNAKYMADDASSKNFLDKADPNKSLKWLIGSMGNLHLKKDYKGGKAGYKANGPGTNGSVDGSTNSLKGHWDADVILGIRIKHKSNGIAFSPSHYIQKVVSQLEYSRLISCLMYAMSCTRPNVTFAVGILSRYTSNPVLEGYTNASSISNTKDNSSTSGWVFLLGGGAIF
nr:hypothetical protein [Tanacetum cinerariifolium]